MSATATAPLERGAFIDGTAQPIEADTLAISNPATGDLVGRVTSAGARDRRHRRPQRRRGGS